MTTKARVDEGMGAEASTGKRHSGRARRALIKTVLMLLAIAGAGAAGWVLGGDRVWAAFAAGMVLIAFIILRGLQRPDNTEVYAVGGNYKSETNRSTNVTLNTGGVWVILGVVLLVVADGLLIGHVSREVPTGRFYQPPSPTPTSQAATAVAPVFLRDLPESEIRRTSGASAPEGGDRISGKQCSRSIFVSVSSIGRAQLITLTPSTKFQRFVALAGIPDEEHPNVSVDFALLGDDQRMIESRVARPGKPAAFNQDVSAYTTLYLRITLITSKFGSAFGGGYRAVWGDAQFLPVNGRPEGCVVGN